MKTTKEFTIGEISNRLITALQCCEAKNFIQLKREGHLRLPPQEYAVRNNAMIVYSLSAYCRATETSAYYFLHGDEPQQNRYSAYDDIVISYINMLDRAHSQQLLSYFKDMYPKHISEQMKGLRITDKLLHLFSMLPYGYLTRISNNDATIPHYERLTEEAKIQVVRMRDSGGKKIGVFTTDTIPSLAAFLGISLHFLLELEVPLYCETQDGDLLFDYYTLLNDEEKKTFLYTIEAYLNHEMQRLVKLRDRVKGVISDAVYQH